MLVRGEQNPGKTRFAQTVPGIGLFSTLASHMVVAAPAEEASALPAAFAIEKAFLLPVLVADNHGCSIAENLRCAWFVWLQMGEKVLTVRFKMLS